MSLLSYLPAWTLVCLIVVSLLVLWNTTGIMMLLSEALRSSGWRRDTNFWDAEPITRKEWQTFWTLKAAGGHLTRWQSLLVEGLSCNGCLSCQLGGWIGLVVGLLSFHVADAFLFALACALSIPYPAFFLYARRDRQNPA